MTRLSMPHALIKAFVLLQVIVACSASPLAAQAPASPPPAARPLDRASLEAWLDSLVPPALQKGDIAGLVVSVVKDGELLLEKGYGYAEVAEKTPMDPQGTVLRVASVSKSFTATAVLQLVEQGRLDLDRDVNEYLDFAIPPAFGEPITLRNLLTHTAGFEETAYKRYSPPITLRDNLLQIPERIYPPGQIPAYSNYGVNLAGYIVERVSGMSIADYVERHILEPLGMRRSTFHMTLPAELRPFAASSYPLASAGPYPPTLITELSPVEFPAAGLSATAHDMARFMTAHLQEGRFEDVQLLRPETVRLMHAPAFVAIPGVQPIALGLFRADYKGLRVIGHSGDGEGAHAEMKLLPDQGVGIFTAVNSDGVVEGFLPAAFTLRAELFERFVDRYFPTPPAADEPTVATAKEHARLAAGEYVWSRQQKGDFQEALSLIGRFALKPVIRANDDGTIETTPFMTFEESGRTQRWREVGAFVWREVGGDAHLFMNVSDGKVRAVWSDQVPAFWVGLPVPDLMSARLNVPLLGLATLSLLATVLLWPVVAVLRRRTGTSMEWPAAERRADRLTRIAAALGVLYMAGWAVAMIADYASTVGAEPRIRVIQAIGLICVVGAAIAVWNVVLTWRGKRGAGAKGWSVVMALALLYLAWFSFAFHLISGRLN